MSTDKRVIQSQASTHAIKQILRSVVSDPHQYAEDEDLKKALKSQGGVAKLEYEVQIGTETVHKHSMSLNTLKTYADELFDDGFEGLNYLRLKAIDVIYAYIHRSSSPNTQSRAGLQLKIKELEDGLEKHRSINFILLQAISSAMGTIRSIQDAADDSIREKRANDGLARIRAIASLNPHPFDNTPSSVVSIKDYKNEQ
ncbi:hypothetical protein [Marinobacter maritimus]|uniref:hypothetical protein n=1 Tax=Marinobacter maritimus TaxID=277961 RepID=UPI0011A12967|nr:hypothetical protein [Marinobacter maritimus]